MNIGNPKIRLSEPNIKAIKEIFIKYFFNSDQLWLFGSRTDLNKKGGDIDLYIESDLESYALAVDKKVAFLCEVKQKIGDQKIDVVIKLKSSNYQLAIYDIAKAEGVQLI